MPQDKEAKLQYGREYRARKKAEGAYKKPVHRDGYNAEYYLKNRDRIVARRRERDALNSEQRRANRNAWAAKNPDKIKAQKQRLRKRHADRLNREMRVYLKQKPSGSDLTRGQIYKRRRREKFREKINERERIHGMRSSRRIEIQQKLKICNYLCYICGLHLELKDLEIDHVFPVARGGENRIENLMPAHKICNRRKGDKLDYPIKRPDLIEATKCVQKLPPGKRKVPMELANA